MKPITMLLVLFVVALGTSPAQGQTFRAGMGVARGASFAPAGVAAGFTIQNTQGLQSSATGLSQGGQSIQFRGGGTQITIQSSPRSRLAGGVTIWPSHTHVPFAPVRSWQFASFHPWHHGNPWFPRHPGILIIEVPGFSGTSITTQTVPGSGWSDQPVAENPPADSRLRAPGRLAPFDPTPQEVVDRMLALAGVKKGDVVYDLGSGDGRVVIAAAKKYGAKAVGFELDPGLVKLARENARLQGVEKLVEFHQRDFMTVDLAPASVVTLYLSYDGNLALRPRLVNQLKPGARLVSYTFDMGDWPPKIMENYRDAGGETHALYFWQIGDTIAFR